MKNPYLLILAGLFPFFLSAQQGSVKGKLLDTTTRQLLSNATVAVVVKKDSSLFGYTLSDAEGVFEIKNIPAGDYNLFISFSGYEVFKIPFSVASVKSAFDFGVISLQPDYKTLSSVVVTTASPVKINGDTISFKAGAFNSKPGASVEELLKKIPGIQVQKDGTIKAMGEQVQKIYVDGKEFFGNDPKIATRNLTADMVDQIQVFDDMSEQARFTKIDDGSRTKSINIKLKKDRRRGDFGRLNAGAGSGSRYEGNFSLNHFRGDKRISLVGSANNTNKLNYSFSDFSSAQSGSSQFNNGGNATGSEMINTYGASPGTNRPISTGINYNDTWGSKIDFRASYFYSDNSNILEQTKLRRNTFPGDSASETNSYSNILNNNRAHRVNSRWEFHIDSANSILYTANFSKQYYEGTMADTSITMSAATSKYLAAKANTDRHDGRNGINYTGELLYRRKFRKTGRTFTLGWRNGYGKNNLDNSTRSAVTTYNRNDTIASFININQTGLQETEMKNNTISASYTEPIGRNKLIELNYAYSDNNNVSDKKTYDYNSGSGKYDLLNSEQTNYFDYNNTSRRVGFNFRHQLKKVNYQIGIGMQKSQMQNKSIDTATGKDTIIRQRFTNIFPIANINYAITSSKNIRFYYRGRSNVPGIAQLQNVPDVSNPLMIRTGNASLKQEFIHNFNLSYNSFEILSQRFFSANLSTTYVSNKIVNSIDSAGIATLIYRPENMNGSFNTTGTVSLTFPFNKDKSLNANFSNMMYLSRDASLVFKKKNFTTLFQLNQTAGISYGKDNLDLAISGGFVYNSISYNFESGTNTNYFNQVYSTDFTYRFKNKVYFMTDFDYYISTGRTAGFNQDVFLWNMSLGKKFFKTNTGEIKFTVYDILKQNNGINRNIGENYFEDVRANVLPHFFLVSMNYNFNRVGTKSQSNK